MRKNSKHKCTIGSKNKLATFDASKVLGAPFGVTLHDSVQVQTCNECGSQMGISIPKPNDLLATVALKRVANPIKLNGKEVRFLRKCLHLRAKEMARTIGMTAGHLSKIENGHLPISLSLERLLRMHICIEYFGSAHESLHAGIKSVPNMDIVSVRDVNHVMSFSFSLEAVEVSSRSAPPSDDDPRHYTERVA